MGVRKSPGLPKNTSTASCTPLEIKPISSIPPKRQFFGVPASRARRTPASATMVGEESEKKPKKKKNAGADWSVEDEILLLNAMLDHVKRGENFNSEVFYKLIQSEVNVNVSCEQIKRKIKYIRERYVAIENTKKAGKVWKFREARVKEYYELSKLIYESGGEPTDDGGGGEAVRVRVEEHGEGTDGAVEEPEEEDVGEKQKEIDAVETKEKKKKKKTKAGAAEERPEENIQVNREKQKEVEAVEAKEKNNNKKRKAGAGDEKEISKKKKRKVANADSVSEILIAQLTKASFSFRLLLNEETKKAIKSMEPSKVVSLTQEVKNFEVEKKDMLLKEADLVHKLVEVLSGTVIEPSQVVSITQESKNFEVVQMKMLWKQVALVRKVAEVLSS